VALHADQQLDHTRLAVHAGAVEKEKSALFNSPLGVKTLAQSLSR
jgi:hypothetical protein